MKKIVSIIGVLSIISVFLVGCGGPKDEKQAFIDSTIEATCHIFQAENIFDPVLEEEAVEIYAKYGFDADDKDAMEALNKKYESDAEVESKIMEGLEACGGDLFSGLEETFGDMEDIEVEDLEMDEPIIEDETVKEMEVTEEETTEGV